MPRLLEIRNESKIICLVQIMKGFTVLQVKVLEKTAVHDNMTVNFYVKVYK